MAALVAVSTPRAVRHTWQRLVEVWTLRGENVADARRRAYGEAYWNGIEALQAEIPKDGAYFLSKDTEAEGTDYWIRFDLAPRKPILVAKNAMDRRAMTVAGRPEDGPPFVVSARGPERAPALLDADTFWGGVPVLRAALEDYGIPANIDGPAEGERVHGRVIVQGWCQERGGRPCAEVKIFLDAELRAVEVERFPRPDVEAAVPGIGACATAGYRATVQGVEPGGHVLWVLFRTADGRYRRFGPRNFTVAP